MLQRTRGLVPDVQSGFAPRCFGGNAGQGYAAFYGGNDIRQGNGVGAARQNMAASYAPKTLHYSLGLQQAVQAASSEAEAGMASLCSERHNSKCRA